LYIYICIAIGDLISKRGKVWITLTGLIKPHLCAIPSKNLDIRLDMLWSFLCSMIWGVRWLIRLLIMVELLTVTV